MSDNLLVKIVKKSVFDLLSMTVGQCIIMLVLFIYNCIFSTGERSGDWIWFIFCLSWLNDLVEANMNSLADLPMDRRTFWKFIYISEWFKRYLLILLIALPLLLKGFLTGSFSAVCGLIAPVLAMFFWVDGIYHLGKWFKMGSICTLKIVFIIGFLALGAIASESDASFLWLALIVIATVIYDLGKYFCLRDADPYTISEITAEAQ